MQFMLESYDITSYTTDKTDLRGRAGVCVCQRAAGPGGELLLVGQPSHARHDSVQGEVSLCWKLHQ